MSPRKQPIKKPARSYHHADLRRALLDAAIVSLREGDVTSLTMQMLARAAGVSPGAPYHHFADKVAVVAALATEGFALWLEGATQAVKRATTPQSEFEAIARLWLRFADAHPSHYRVMFLPDVEDRVRFAELHETSGQGLALLVGVLARCLPGASSQVLMGRAVVAWSTLHGFASLRSARVLTNIPGLPSLRSLERDAVEQVVAVALLPVQVSPSAAQS
jgi:AcrR family transcriptional regulator